MHCRKEKEGGGKEKKPPKKSTMREKWTEDPDYVKATGGKLHPYQLEGVNWIRFSYAQVSGAGMLALKAHSHQRSTSANVTQNKCSS